MKKHWTSFLRENSSFQPLLVNAMNELTEQVERYEEFAKQMRNKLEEHDKAVLELAKMYYNEDEITAAIGKAMIHEINDRQGGGQRITFTSLG